MSGWQDIATAPKDCWLLTYCPDHRHTGWATRPHILGQNTRGGFYDEEGYPLFPTHWMPLPEAPAALSAIDEGRGG